MEKGTYIYVSEDAKNKIEAHAERLCETHKRFVSMKETIDVLLEVCEKVDLTTYEKKILWRNELHKK